MEDLKIPTVIHESDVSFFPTALRWGLISAGVSIAYALIANLLGLTTSQVTLNTLISFAIVGIIAYMCIKNHKEELEGFISFGRAFLVVFVALLISGAISSIFNFVYMNYIDPSSMDQMTQNLYAKMGLPEDQIEMALEEAKKGMENPIGILWGFIAVGVIAAIVAVIMAAIMKEERPASI
jgi:uncharacterized membrane protein YuzA (DUF378 family)